MIKELLPLGVLTINQALDLLNLPRVEDGDERIQSLNYIEKTLAKNYQMGDKGITPMKEIRSAEIQTDKVDGEMVLEGTPIVFNKPALIKTPTGSYTEVIKRNALDGLKLNDTRLLVSHDHNRLPLAKHLRQWKCGRTK